MDRTRLIRSEMRAAPVADRPRLANQIEVIYRRARLIQFSIVMGILSALFAALLVLTLFFTALMKWNPDLLISFFFICCLVSLLASLVVFIMEICLALRALKVELAR
jgi:hypothetical protein